MNQNKKATPIGLLPAIFLCLISLLIPLNQSRCAASNDPIASLKNWKELCADPQYSINQSCSFYRLKTTNGNLVALVVFDLNDRTFTLKPFFNEKNNTVSSVVKKRNALIGINGGFFNLNNGESTSYVVIDNKPQCDPKQNKALTQNADLTLYLEAIFNRSELRILKDTNGKRKATIVKHNDPVPTGWTLEHSLQAGPMLLPTITDAEEAFTRKSPNGNLIDSIGSLKKAARTAIGITLDNHVLLLSVANKNQDEFSCGVTLAELSTMLQQLGCNRALNLDGGTSSTFVIAEGSSRNNSDRLINKVIAGSPEKLVKSGWLIEKTAREQKPEDLNTNFPR